MDSFDPDAYLASKQPAASPAQGFDPDAYLAEKGGANGFLGTLAGHLGAGETVRRAADIIGHANPIAGAAHLADFLGKKVNDAAYSIGGKATDVASDMGASPQVAAGIGAVANTASQALPQLGFGVGKMAAPLVRDAAEGLMMRAVNPTFGDLASGKAARAISTMLDNGINPTVSSMNNVRGKINDLRNQINTIVDASPKSVDLVNASAAIRQELKRFTNQVNPSADLKAIQSAWNEFIQHPLVNGQSSIPIRTAQDLKAGTNALLREKAYGEVGTASEQAQKAMVRGLKEGINVAEPSIAPLNAESANLYNVLNVAERSALANLKANPIGMNMLAQNPTKLLAFTAAKSGRFKAALAHMLNENQTALSGGLGAAAGSLAIPLAGRSDNAQP